MEEDRAKKVTELVQSLLHRINVSPETLNTVLADTDWAFIIKLHAMIEASLNHLLIKRLGDDRLIKIVVQLEMGNLKTGKLAFAEALDLLPSPCRAFIKWFGEIRNQLAHSVENLDFNLASYLQKMDKQRRKALLKSMDTILPSAEMAKLLEQEPRTAISTMVWAVLCYIEEHAASLPEIPRPSEDALGREESSPKES